MERIQMTLLLLIFFTALSLHQSSSTPQPNSLHDLLPQFGFPKGLIPNAIKSYSLSDNGDFEVELLQPCYVHFEYLVYYDKNIKGKLKYGSISDVSGIQAKQAFLWVPVTGMLAYSGFVEFHVGFLSKKLPAEQFEDIPICKSKSCGPEKASLASQGAVEKEQMVPLIEPVGMMESVMGMNGTSRRRLGSFKICALCTCCGGPKGLCLPSPCCYAINCNIPNRPFGYCSFTPKTCNCFGCHL